MNKTIEYYMQLPYKMEITPDSNSTYFVRFPELPGCFSAGETVAEAVENAEDAKKCWLTAALEDLKTIPESKTDRDFSGEYKLRMPKSLHHQIYDRAKEEGISMNQFCILSLQKAVGR